MDRKMDSCTRLIQSIYRLQQRQQQQLMEQKQLEKPYEMPSQINGPPVQNLQSSSSPTSELSPTNTTTTQPKFFNNC